MQIRFAVNSYKSDSLPVSAQRCVNAYAETQPKDAKVPVAVFGAPGIADFATVGRGPIRAMHKMGDYVYVVSRSELYRLSSDGTILLVGAGITGLGTVKMDGNGTEIIVVNGLVGFIYNSSTGVFSQISDGDFYAANTVAFIDQMFVLDRKGTGQFFRSGLLDGTSYSALDIATAESRPDNIMAVVNHNGLLALFGEETTELWANTGALSFTFQRIEGGTVQRGLAAVHAYTSADNGGLFFLGDDRVFYRMDGNRPIRISTHAIEKAWEKYDTIDDAFCFTVPFGGHKFVYITFPTENETWGTDIATGYLWHERESYDRTSTPVRWRVNCAVSAFGKLLVGDSLSGKVGYIDADAYTEFDDIFITELVSPPISDDHGRMVFIPGFDLDMDGGVGLLSGQGSEPQIMLDWSIDGGQTYSTPQLWRSMGKIGVNQTRVQWDSLGSAYEFTLRVRIADPVKRVIQRARAPGLFYGVEI